jgi:hypothetical protein
MRRSSANHPPIQYIKIHFSNTFNLSKMKKSTIKLSLFFCLFCFLSHEMTAKVGQYPNRNNFKTTPKIKKETLVIRDLMFRINLDSLPLVRNLLYVPQKDKSQVLLLGTQNVTTELWANKIVKH